MGDEARQRKRTGIGANGFYTGEPAWGPISLARDDPGEAPRESDRPERRPGRVPD